MAITAKEAFWKEHKDSLVRIRSQLSNGKTTPPYRRTPVSQPAGRKSFPLTKSRHLPYGKYKRTPSPYLAKVDDPVDRGPRTPPLRGSKYEVIPPVRPKQAFTRSKPDYDSWGEESDDEGEEEEGEDNGGRRGRYKPKPYPQLSPMMMEAPFAMYYPPPPKGNKYRSRKMPAAQRGYKDMYRDRQAQVALSKSRRNKVPKAQGSHSLPVFMPVSMMPVMVPMENKYKYIYGEEDSSDEEDMDPNVYFSKHPMFAQDVVDSLIKELLEEEILPDTLMESLKEYDRWPYDHPAYLPTLYASEDLMEAGLKEQVQDIVREVMTEIASDYLDEKRLKRDPLEDFLNSVLNDAVELGVRDVVRESVLEMADRYMLDETASAIYTDVFREELKKFIPGVLDDVMVDLVAEDFIAKEVIAPEVEEEAQAVATEILQHYDNKITKRELKEVMRKANGRLVDSLVMDYVMSILSRQGKLFTQDDHANRYLDDTILNIAMEQYFNVQKTKDKTVENKPLKKLHEKAFIEVALDASLQQLTASLDEDLADVDEFERGVTAEAGYPITLSHS